MISLASKIAARLCISSYWARFAILGALPRHAVGAEIGVHLGDFAARILLVARPRKLFLVDPWECQTGDDYRQCVYGSLRSDDDEMERRYFSVKKRFAERIKRKQVCLLRQTSVDALGGMADEVLDFVYIDGNHRYEFVRQDLELALRKVKSGGIIAGDDYTSGGWWQGGVKKAVDEFGWQEGVKLLWISGHQFVFEKTRKTPVPSDRV